jgi:hypothetical protein
MLFVLIFSPDGSGILFILNLFQDSETSSDKKDIVQREIASQD